MAWSGERLYAETMCKILVQYIYMFVYICIYINTVLSLSLYIYRHTYI